MTVVALFPTLLPFGTEADEPLRVLRPDLSERVAAVNTVRHLLAELDIPVVSQDLIRNGNRPLLVLSKGDLRLRGLAQSIRLDGDSIRAVIGTVEVRWPHQALDPTSSHSV